MRPVRVWVCVRRLLLVVGVVFAVVLDLWVLRTRLLTRRVQLRR